jgi:Tol biopolymer transport system component
MTRVLTAAVALLSLLQAAPPSPPPSTDIYLLELLGGLDSLKNVKPRPVATDKGYENQPFFTPDGRMILFTANREGKQTDIYEYTIGGATRPLIATPESEYSPTITPDGGISVIRVESDGTQRLWRFDRDGSTPRVLLENVKPVGYHAWIDNSLIALFVLGQPATLRLARPGPGEAETLASGIGRSIHRVPGKRAVSFVHREGDGTFAVKELNVDDKRITTLTPVVEGSTDRDTAWTADGTLLMSARSKVFAWSASARGSTGWREVFDVAPHRLGNVSRIAVSPDGKAIAIVVARE